MTAAARAFRTWRRSTPATTLGLLFADTPMITGPFAGAAGGVDLSLVVTLRGCGGSSGVGEGVS
ncbi:hypothetical protein AB0K15_08895 [Amycolatopsis sp. NPDC049253]|uniref:hypothetical protein n=1 Tax=Amycolatopsis sp. NPDC049253 TaxID=3155274 RepID=UPI003437F2E4